MSSTGSMGKSLLVSSSHGRLLMLGSAALTCQEVFFKEYNTLKSHQMFHFGLSAWLVPHHDPCCWRLHHRFCVRYPLVGTPRGCHAAKRISRVGTVVRHDERARCPSRNLALRSLASWSTSLRVLAWFPPSRFQSVGVPPIRWFS